MERVDDVIIHVDNIKCRLEPRPSEMSAVEEVKKTLVCFAPGYKYTYLYKRKLWDGKVSLTDGLEFQTGLLPKVAEGLSKYRVEMEMDDNRVISTVTLKPTTLPLYDFQREVVKGAFENTLWGTWWPRGVIKVSTGGGKTEMACAMIEMAGVSTLFFVHTKDLLHQTAERFKKYGLDCGMLGDGIYETDNKVTVATIQTLWGWLNSDDKRKVEIALHVLKNTHQVFFDEAHLLAADVDKGNIFIQTAAHLPRAYMRWGLTATPFMKDEYSNQLLQSVTGGLLCDITNRQLIDTGYLAEGKVTMYNVPSHLSVPNSWPECYEQGVCMHNGRNDKIVELLKTMPQPILVLVTRVGHGEILERKAKEAGLNVPLVWGKHKSKERKKLIEQLKNGQCKAVIASTIWNQGVDIPQIKTLILAGGGKSPVATLQKLGRGLRLSKGKEHVEIIDFFDHSTRWLRNHSKSRKKTWMQEGFAIQERAL
jgi:superfamily II DNA or RNA helicase